MVSHNINVPSKDSDARILPHGEKHIDVTLLLSGYKNDGIKL